MPETRLPSIAALALLFAVLDACSSVSTHIDDPPDADAGGDADADVDGDDDAGPDADSSLETCDLFDYLDLQAPDALSADVLAFGDGSFVVLGRMTGSVDFGEGALTIETEEVESFVARFSSAGELQWVERIRGDSSEVERNGVALSDGALLLRLHPSGEPPNTIVLGVGADEEILEPRVGEEGGFVVKYLPTGERRLVASSGVPSADGGWFGVTSVSREGTLMYGSDYTLVSYGPDGEQRWARYVGGSVSNVAFVPQPDGSVIVQGGIIEPYDLLGQTVPGECAFESYYGAQLAVRLGADGRLLWARCLGTHWDLEELAATDDGGLLAVARFDEEDFGLGVTFGGGDASIVWDGPAHRGELLARFGPDGAPEWIRPPARFAECPAGSECRSPPRQIQLLGDGTAIGEWRSPVIELGDGEDAVTLAPSERWGSSAAFYGERGELTRVDLVDGLRPDGALPSPDGSTMFVGYSAWSLGFPFVAVGLDGAGIVEQTTSPWGELFIAALDRERAPVWTGRVGRGHVFGARTLPLGDDGILAAAWTRSAVEYSDDRISFPAGSDGRLGVAAGRFERDGTLSWVRELASVDDPCPTPEGLPLVRLFECPGADASAADLEPFEESAQYLYFAWEIEDRVARWLDPACFHRCADPPPPGLCWEARCTGPAGAAIEARGTMTSRLEATGAAQELVVERSWTAQVAPPAGVEPWSSIEYERTWVSRADAASDDRSSTGEWSFSTRWTGTIDPSWPADSSIRIEQHGTSAGSSTSFVLEQCEVDCVNEVCAVF